MAMKRIGWVPVAITGDDKGPWEEWVECHKHLAERVRLASPGTKFRIDPVYWEEKK